MDIEQIIDSVNALSEKEKNKWSFKSIRLFKQFESSLFLSEPYRLVLDSNVIMRFEDIENEKNNSSLLAILTFFNFFNSQKEFRASILIRPAVFYEFIRRRQISDEIDYWNQCKRIRKLIYDTIGIDALFEGLSSYEVAKSEITNIQDDETTIKRELKSILSKDWDFNFIQNEVGFVGFPRDENSYIALPVSVARESVKLPELKYFDTQIAKLCLADHILKRLVTNKNNDQEIIAKYYNPDNHLLHKILKFRTNGELEGLADLDFLSLCNVNRQFQIQANYNYLPSSIPMTVDKKLDEGLHEFSKAVVVNTTITVGEPEELIRMKHEQSFEQQKRVKKSEKLFESFRILARNFWSEVDEKI
ncbi:hypothetical protein [Labilibaculum euxinus]